MILNPFKSTLFILYILILCAFLNSCASSNSATNENEEFEEVPVPTQFITEEYPQPDVWAKYPGGKENLDWYIRMNTIIPEKARKEGYQGRVLLSYEVDNEGQAGNPEVLMSPHPAITEMYREIIFDMEKWEPAMLNNEPVP